MKITVPLETNISSQQWYDLGDGFCIYTQSIKITPSGRYKVIKFETSHIRKEAVRRILYWLGIKKDWYKGYK
jgi:hypothetical protein